MRGNPTYLSRSKPYILAAITLLISFKVAIWAVLGFTESFLVDDLDPYWSLGSDVTVEILGAIVMLWFVHRQYGIRGSDIGLELGWLAGLPLGPLFGLTAFFLVQFIYQIPLSLAPEWLTDRSSYDFLESYENAPTHLKPLFFFEITVLTSICEEILYRGIVFALLYQAFTPSMTIIISSLIFGVVHFDPEAVVIGFTLGCGFAWLREVTKSLGAPILAHMTFNSIVALSS